MFTARYRHHDLKCLHNEVVVPDFCFPTFLFSYDRAVPIRLTTLL